MNAWLKHPWRRDGHKTLSVAQLHDRRPAVLRQQIGRRSLGTDGLMQLTFVEGGPINIVAEPQANMQALSHWGFGQ